MFGFDMKFQLHHTGIKKVSSKNCTSVSALFQLHHTGIKKGTDLLSNGKGRNFNCTIQELKNTRFELRNSEHLVFQLHHTGIKNHISRHIVHIDDHFNCTIQELKMLSALLRFCRPSHFNCTIQELKIVDPPYSSAGGDDFNCTIQELKKSQLLTLEGFSTKFQLHHTGIKKYKLDTVIFSLF